MYANMCIMRLPERKENERGAERFFEKNNGQWLSKFN